MICFTSEVSFEHIRHVDTSHLSIIMVTYISCKGRWLGFKVLFLKIFICDTLFQLFTTSKIITAATAVVRFYFQSQPWGGFTSTNFFFFFFFFFFRVLPHQKRSKMCFHLMKYGTSIGRYSLKTAVLNIFPKFLEKHLRQSSCST